MRTTCSITSWLPFALALGALLGSLAGAGCTKSTPETPKPSPNGAGEVEAPAAKPAPPPTDEPAPPADAQDKANAPMEEYLVWHNATKGTGPITKWVRASADPSAALEEVAQAPATVISDGRRLWVVGTHWSSIRLEDCCVLEEAEPSEECLKQPTGSSYVPQLQVHPIYPPTVSKAFDSDPTIVAISADEQGWFGEIYDATVRIHGSVGPVVWASKYISQFACGAHGSYDASFVGFDASTGAAPTWARPEASAVPEARKRAYDELLEHFEAEPDSEQEGLNALTLESWAFEAGGGNPVVEYHFLIEATWVGSDGVWSGYTRSAFAKAPPVAGTGLPPTLPPLVAAALATAPAEFGYAKLELQGEEREAALRAFRDTSRIQALRGTQEAPAAPDGAETGSAETNSAETNSAETNSAETNSAETNSAETNSAETGPTATAPATSPSPATADVPTLDAPGKSAAAWIAEGRQLTQEEKYRAAIGAFTQAINADSQAARAWSGRGYAQFRANLLDEAESDLRTALTLDTSAKFRASVAFNLGQIAEQRGQPAAARALYEESLGLQDNAIVRQRRDALPAPELLQPVH